MRQNTKDKTSCDGGANMKRIRFVRTGVLLLLLGIAAPFYANQHQGQDKQHQAGQSQKDKGTKQQNQNKQQQQRAQQQQPAKGERQQQRAQQQQPAKGERQQQRAQQHQPAKGQRQQQHAQQQQPARGQQQGNRPSRQVQHVQQGQQQAVWQQHRATNWQSQHRDWQQRGGYNGYRIPDDRYRANFGAGHWFRINRYPMELYGGYPRFQYGGFWFGLVDPWPEYWPNDWYDNDDVYIVYTDGGYYLCNRSYPRDRIAITVYLN
jgi:hypothetical protein